MEQTFLLILLIAMLSTAVIDTILFIIFIDYVSDDEYAAESFRFEGFHALFRKLKSKSKKRSL